MDRRLLFRRLGGVRRDISEVMWLKAIRYGQVMIYVVCRRGIAMGRRSNWKSVIFDTKYLNTYEEYSMISSSPPRISQIHLSLCIVPVCHSHYSTSVPSQVPNNQNPKTCIKKHIKKPTKQY